MNYIKLNNGIEMPQEGFGVYQIPDGEEAENAVYSAIQIGYRLIDTAAVYGNEASVGRAVKRAVADGLTTRGELFIQTKVWFEDMKTEESAYEAVKAALNRLDMEYIDSIILHLAMGDYFAAYRGITRAYKEGLVRAIGVSNFYPAILADFCENVEVIPAVNQIELHPYFIQTDALEVAKFYGVLPQAWAPLAEGRHGIFTDPVLTQIGSRYGKSAAQVVLRWNLQRGVSILPKSTHVDRMQQNLDVWDFELTEEEMAAINAKDLGCAQITNHFDYRLIMRLNGRME